MSFFPQLALGLPQSLSVTYPLGMNTSCGCALPPTHRPQAQAPDCTSAPTSAVSSLCLSLRICTGAHPLSLHPSVCSCPQRPQAMAPRTFD